MNKYFSKLSEIKDTVTNHGEGTKFVFRSNNQLSNALTQIAKGKFLPGEECKEHIHNTMFEYFFFIKGEGSYKVGDEFIKIEPGVFLEIPPKIPHYLIAKGNETLEFVYWGVAIGNI